MSFSDDLNQQHLPRHIQHLERLGYHPIDRADEAERLRDVYCPEADTQIECKSDRYVSNRFCIELVGNLPKIPTLDKYTDPEDANYPALLQFIRNAYQNPKFRSLGLSTDVYPRHLVSYLFVANDRHFCFPLQQLQQVTHQALRERTCSIMKVQSFDSGNVWYSLNLMVPIGLLVPRTAAAAA